MNNKFSISEEMLIDGVDISDELNMKIHTCSIDDKSNSKLTCFSFFVTSEDVLRVNWQELTNEIAMNYISHLDNSFSKWNCYIVFFCSLKLSIDLKYKIENNKFAARKLVVDNLGRGLNDTQLNNVINNRILDSNIELNQSEVSISKELELSDISQRLIDKNFSLVKNEESIKARQDWISSELKRDAVDEN